MEQPLHPSEAKTSTNNTEAYGSTKDSSAVAVPSATTNSGDLAASSRFMCMKYSFFLLLGYLICLLLRNNTVKFLSKLPGLSHGCADDRCFGSQGVYRVSFSLFMFFLVHWMMATKFNCCLDPNARLAFQRMSLKWKTPVFVIFLILAFVIPNQFFVGYGWVCLAASAIFLIIQVLVLIDFAYSWNEDWIAKAEELGDDNGGSRFTFGLLFCSLLFFAASFTVLGFSYKWFPCELGKSLISITLVANTFNTIISIKAPKGSLVPSSMVMAYNTALMFTALTSLSSPQHCNDSFSGHSGAAWVIALNTFFSAISITYAAMSSAHSRGTFSLSEDDSVEPGEEECSPYSFFHATMMLASCYLAMLLTSWDVTGQSSENVDSNTSMWVKAGCTFFTAFLYCWSLIAPILFPHRFQD
eukprot:PhM_4_TR3099/c0_g1_i1/m.104371